MPPRDWKIRVSDILEALEKIAGYTSGMNENQFASDLKTVEAVIYNLMIIGEAVNHIPEAIQQKHPEMPWPQMRGIRNILVHEYYKVKPNILWKTITSDLPPLSNSLRKLVKS